MKLFNVVFVSALLAASQAVNWSTYPHVPQTASINGFADRIYADLPTCAQQCVKFDTDNTPCPYWDTGCLCVMPQWSGEVASCIADKCSGDQVSSATYLAVSICTSAGASWVLPASLTTALEKAAEETGAAAASATTTAASGASTASVISSSTSVANNSSSMSVSASASASATGSSGGSATAQQLGLLLLGVPAVAIAALI